MDLALQILDAVLSVLEAEVMDLDFLWEFLRRLFGIEAQAS